MREINTNWAVNFLLLRMTCKKDSPIVMFVCYFSGLVGNKLRIRSISIINLIVGGFIIKSVMHNMPANLIIHGGT